MWLNRNLEIFFYVAQKGSITEVAEQLYISAPAVSQAVKTIENQVGVPLFIRNKRQGMQLTNAGEKVFHLVGQMFGLDKQIEQVGYQEKNLITGNIKIGTIPMITGCILAKPLAKFKKLYPEVKVEVFEGTPVEVSKMVENGLVDFAITCTPFGNIDHEILITDEIVAIFSQDKDMPNQIDLKNGVENMILVKEACETISEVVKTDFSLSFAKSFLVRDTDTVVRLVKEGLGVGLISKYTLNSIPNNLKYCKVLPYINIGIGVAALDLSAISPASKEFIKLIKIK